MIERNLHAYRVSSIAALLALSACTLDTQATGTQVPDGGGDASFDLGPQMNVLDASLEDDAGEDDAGDEPMDASTADDDAGLDASAEDAGSDAAEPEGPLGDGGYPELLSQTGLYQSIALDTTRSDVLVFQPRFALWSDGAAKRRWLKLPPKTQIDTSSMDAWNFPVGTKAWKEFRVGGVRVETRMLHRVTENEWVMVAYRWRKDQTDADAVPQGEANALGTAHDIPDQTMCARCHNSQGVLLGVSALQLSHQLPGLNLELLSVGLKLSHPPKGTFKIPGGPLAENALGYLHANCGHCHRPGTAAYTQILKREPKTGGPILWERTDALDKLENTVGYQSTVLRANSVLPDLHIIEPGYPDKSELVVRASQRGVGTLQMPPIGTEVVDDTGLKQVKDWIQSLKK